MGPLVAARLHNRGNRLLQSKACVADRASLPSDSKLILAFFAAIGV